MDKNTLLSIIMVTFAFLQSFRICESKDNQINFRIYESNVGTDGPAIEGYSQANLIGSSSSNQAITNEVDWSDVDITDPQDASLIGTTDQKQQIPPDDPHPSGEHKHLTDNAIIYHKDNEPSHYGVSRYPPYITENGTHVYGPPDKDRSQTSPNPQYPPRAPVPPEPLLQIPSEQPDRNQPLTVGQVGGNQDTPTLLTSSNNNQSPASNSSGPTLGNFTMGLLALGKALMGGFNDMSPNNQTKNATTPQRGVYLVDDARCKNYTTQICHQKWMQKHCPDMCRGHTQTPSPKPATTMITPATTTITPATTTQVPTNAPQVCCPCAMPATQCPCVPPPCPTPVAPTAATMSPATPVAPTAATLSPATPVAPTAATMSPATPVAPSSATFSPAKTTLSNSVDDQQKVVEDPQCKLYPKETCNTPFMQLTCPQTCMEALQPPKGAVITTPPPVSLTSALTPTIAKESSKCKQPTTSGGCCKFPFKYQNTPIYDCLPSSNNKTWCATTDDFDKDAQWGECGTPTETMVTLAPITTSVPTTVTMQTQTTQAPQTQTTTPQVCCPCAGGYFECQCQPPPCPPTNMTTPAPTPVLCCPCSGGATDCPCVQPPCPSVVPTTTPSGMVCDPWPKFGPCSKTCGGGEQFRTRNCTISDGSVIQENEKHLCGMQPCPIDYTEWSQWSECLNGKQWRNRTGTWEDLGYNITIPYIESRPCQDECERASEWTDWSECTKTCDGGIQYRTRDCFKGTLMTKEQENRTCNTQPCTEECGDWSAFSDCSKTCGGGMKTRWRTCGGSIVEDKLPCNETPCPSANETDYECGDWVDWGQCSATCNGMQSRYRHCKNHTLEFDEMQTRPCNTNPCPGTPGPPTTATTPITTTPITTTTSVPTTTPSGSVIPFEECLVAYLSFDVVDTIKKLVYDEGPYGNDFTYNGNVKFLPANYSCKNAASIHSDGDLYYAGPGFTNSPDKGATIAMWVHPTDLMHKQSIFTSKAIGSKGANLQLDLEAGKVRWLYNDLSGQNNFTVVTDAVIAADEWVHIAATYNSTTQEAKVFINAKEMGVASNIQNASELLPWNMFAALFPPVYENKFKGLIDEFYVYNCSLTIEQILVIADTCKDEGGKVCPSPLLGVCPPCEGCERNITTTPLPPSNILQEYSINSNSTQLPGKETDPGPFEEYKGPENKNPASSPKIKEDKPVSGLNSNLPKYWQPKHLKAKQIK